MLTTIKKTILFSGIGVHSGKKEQIFLHPFQKKGLFIKILANDDKPQKIGSKNYSFSTKTSIISIGDISIFCPEHLFGALFLSRIDSILLEVKANTEIPCQPDNELSFYSKISEEKIEVNSIEEYKDNNTSYNIFAKKFHRSISIQDNINPHYGITCNFGSKNLKTIMHKLAFSEISKKSPRVHKVAAARTWITEQNLKILHDKHLGAGVNKENTIIIKDIERVDPKTLKECTRHKLLDLLGDLYISGILSIISVKAVDPGHRINNHALLQL